MSDMKLCIDCENCLETSYCKVECKEPTGGKIIPVLTMFSRGCEWACGAGAKYFKPKVVPVPDGWEEITEPIGVGYIEYMVLNPNTPTYWNSQLYFADGAQFNRMKADGWRFARKKAVPVDPGEGWETFVPSDLKEIEGAEYKRPHYISWVPVPNVITRAALPTDAIFRRRKTIDPGKGYRIIPSDESRKGDQAYVAGEWRNMDGYSKEGINTWRRTTEPLPCPFHNGSPVNTGTRIMCHNAKCIVGPMDYNSHIRVDAWNWIALNVPKKG